MTKQLCDCLKKKIEHNNNNNNRLQKAKFIELVECEETKKGHGCQEEASAKDTSHPHVQASVVIDVDIRSGRSVQQCQ